MADAFFFELPKEQPAKCLSYGFRQGENRIKKPYFYRTVEIKQPHALTGPLERLCYRKWLMLFSLKLQRDNRKNALAVDPAKGKTGKKAVFFIRTVEMKQPHTIPELFFKQKNWRAVASPVFIIFLFITIIIFHKCSALSIAPLGERSGPHR